MDYYVSSGQVSSGIILDEGTMTVLSGGTAIDTQVTSSGWMIGWMNLESGGTAIRTVVDGGCLQVVDGAVIDTVVSNGGQVYVYNHAGSNYAVISNMRVGAGGTLDVYGARTVDNVEIESGGYLTCGPGDSVLNNITVRAGGKFNGFLMTADTAVAESFHVSGAVIEDFDMATLYKNQAGSNITVANCGYLNVENGGSAAGTVVQSGGNLNAYDGSILTNTIVEGGGTINGFFFESNTFIASGVHISGAAVMEGSFANLYKNQTGSNITIANSGYLILSEDTGSLAGTTVQSGGSLYVYGSATLTDTIIERGGTINGFQFETNVFIKSGVNLSGGIVAVDSWGNAYANLYEGQAATDTRVLSGGSLRVEKNVQLSKTFVAAGGVINGFQFDSDRSFASGLHISGAIVSGHADLYRGQSAKDVTVLAGGDLELRGDEDALKSISNITVKANGRLDGFLLSRDSDTVVSKPGVFSNAIVEGEWHPYDEVYPGVDSGYWQYVYAELEDGMVAYGTVINAYGELEIDGGAIGAYDTIVNSGGSLVEDNGAEVVRVTVNNGGYVFVRGDNKDPGCDPAHASYVMVNSGGSMRVGDAKHVKSDFQGMLGVASHTTVLSGGAMSIDRTGTHRGTLTIEKGAKVTADKGAVIDFTVSEMSASDPARINNLSLIRGTPDFTITVSANQKAGVYALAGGAAGFGGTLALGTEKKDYGTITVNGNALKYGGNTYALNVANDTLQLTISGKSTPAPVPATVIEDLGVIAVDEAVDGSLGYDGNTQDNAVLSVGTAGTYRVAGNFGTLNATVTISRGNKAAASGTIKNGVLTFNKGNPALLTTGDYSLVLKSSDKGKTASDYSFSVNTVTPFDKGDNSDDTREDAWILGSVEEPGMLVPDGWVGFGDEIDYYSFTLDNAANLSFDYTATDAAKFTVYDETGKAVLNSSVKADVPLTTKAKLFQAGTYYLSAQSTNAKKGGDADYTVAVNPNSVFYTNGNSEDDTPATAEDLGLVTEPGLLVEDWVGVGDEFDYKAITLDSPAKLNFTVNASDAAKFTVYQLDAKGKLKSLGNVSVKAGATANTKDIFVEDGTYYLSMQSTKAKKDGNAFYSVELNGKTVFFTEGDNTDDTRADARDIGAVSASGELVNDWVGFGDEFDYRKFKLNGGADLSFTVNSTDAVKFTLYNAATGKSVLSASAKAGVPLTTKKKQLAAGEYYISVQSTNAKKGGNAYYSVSCDLAASPAPDPGNSVQRITGVKINWNSGDYYNKKGEKGAIVLSGSKQVSFAGDQFIQVDSITPTDPSDTRSAVITLEKSKDEGIIWVGRSTGNHSFQSGVISTGSGNDTLRLEPDTVLYCGNYDFGAGNDSFILADDADFGINPDHHGQGTLTLDFGTGDDLFQIGRGVDFENSYGPHRISFGDGNDTMRLGVDAWIDFTGDFTLTDFGNGNDTLQIDREARLTVNQLDFGAGNDTLVLNGFLQLNGALPEGLENVSGSGHLLLADIYDLNAADLAMFTNAGISVVNLQDNTWSNVFLGKTEELADNSLATARLMELDEDQEYEGAFWLCGETLADDSVFGFADPVDYGKFTWKRSMNNLSLEMRVRGLPGEDFHFELLDSQGNRIFSEADMAYYDYDGWNTNYELDDMKSLGLVNGATYYVKLSVPEDKTTTAFITAS